MRWIKKFEAKKRNLNPEMWKKAWIKDLKQISKKALLDVEIKHEEWLDVDERSSITFDEFFKKFPFQFIAKSNSDLSDDGIFAPTGFGNIIRKNKIEVNEPIMNYHEMEYINPSAKVPNGFENDIGWFKRNLSIGVKVETGGVAGGSCWDESDPQPYESFRNFDFKEFMQYLEEWISAILYTHPNTKNPSELIKLLEKDYYIIKEDSYTNYEYYGNQTDYKIFYILFYDLFKFLSKNDCF